MENPDRFVCRTYHSYAHAGEGMGRLPPFLSINSPVFWLGNGGDDFRRRDGRRRRLPCHAGTAFFQQAAQEMIPLRRRRLHCARSDQSIEDIYQPKSIYRSTARVLCVMCVCIYIETVRTRARRRRHVLRGYTCMFRMREETVRTPSGS